MMRLRGDSPTASSYKDFLAAREGREQPIMIFDDFLTTLVTKE